MRLIVAVVGRPRQPGLADAIRDYEERARRYWPLDVHEVKDEPVRSGNVDAARTREGARLTAAVGGARVVACDVAGRRYDSTQFADWLQRTREAAVDTAFVIGGAYGLSEAILATSAERLSLAPWTLPHEMARLVLAEQLYRAGTIVRGEPYHK